MRRMNRHDCWDCAKKHLASAIVELGELQRGYWGTDHEIYAMGNLNEASEHLYSLAPELANVMRGLRIDIFTKTKAVEARHIELAKSIYWRISTLESAAPESDKAPLASPDPTPARKHCCGKGGQPQPETPA